MFTLTHLSRSLARILPAVVAASLVLAAPASADPSSGASAAPAAKKPAAATPAAKKPVATKAAPGKSASTKHGVALKAAAKPAAKKPAAMDPATPLGATFLVSDLRRLIVGNQAGVLKVVSRENAVAFIKDAPGTEMKGIDGVQWAPLEDRHRQAILSALSIQENEIEAVAEHLVASFDRLPTLQTMALLGVLASHGEGRISPVLREKIHQTLVSVLNGKDVVQRRHAVLALALSSKADEPTVTKVLDFMASSRNAWETFSVQQFFDYHRAEIRQMAGIEAIRQRIQASGNPYASAILQMIQ